MKLNTKLSVTGVILVPALTAVLSACSGGSVAFPAANPTVAASPARPTTDSDKWERTIPTNPLADPAGKERVIYSADLASEPLRDPVVPDVSEDAAIKVSQRVENVFGADLQPGSPSLNLRLVTVGYPYDSPELVAKPAWILTWNNSKPEIHGPMQLTDKDRQEIADRSECVFVEAIDATSGEILSALQSCDRKS